MTQSDIFEWLVERRRVGDDAFYSVREIAALTGNTNGEVYSSARAQVNKLYAYGYLEIERKNWWHRLYRAKKRYVKKENSQC